MGHDPAWDYIFTWEKGIGNSWGEGERTFLKSIFSEIDF